MLVIDVHTHFGMQAGGNLDLSLPRLVQELDSHRIALAFTGSLRGVSYDHEAGNRETLQATERYPWLLPTATLDLRRYLDWEAEVERCLRAGVRLFRLFPELQRWTISSTPFADLMAKLAGSGAVVMLSSRGAGAPAAIAQATAEYELPVILTDTFYANMGEVIATARRYPHLYIETNYLSSPRAVDIMVGEIGADRLLYGSAAPEFSVQRGAQRGAGSGPYRRGEGSQSWGRTCSDCSGSIRRWLPAGRGSPRQRWCACPARSLTYTATSDAGNSRSPTVAPPGCWR